MAEISIIEFVVYGFLAYSGILMLIISAFRTTPTGQSQSLVRVIWLIPCIFAASLLAGVTENITFETINSVNTITNNETSTIVSTEAITTTVVIPLLQPVWGTIHIMMFLVMLVYVLINILQMFTKIK